MNYVGSSRLKVGKEIAFRPDARDLSRQSGMVFDPAGAGQVAPYTPE